MNSTDYLLDSFTLPTNCTDELQGLSGQSLTDRLSADMHLSAPLEICKDIGFWRGDWPAAVHAAKRFIWIEPAAAEA
jgi:hypothetical protein